MNNEHEEQDFSEIFFQKISPEEETETDSTKKNSSKSHKISKTSTSTKKNKWLPIATAGCIAVAVIAVGAILGNSSKSKSDDITETIRIERKAYLKNYFDFGGAFEDAIGYDKLVTLLSGDSQVNGTLTVRSVPAFDAATGLMAEYALIQDAKTSESLTSVQLSYRSAGIISIDGYTTPKEIIYKIPALDSSAYYMKRADILNDKEFKNYPLAQDVDSDELKTIQNEYLLPMFETFANRNLSTCAMMVSPSGIFDATLNKFAAEEPDDFKRMCNGIKVSSIDSNKDGMKGYSISIAEESVERFVDYMFSIQQFPFFMPHTIVTTKGAKTINYSEEFNKLFNKDLTLTVYLNKDGFVTEGYMSEVITFDDEDITATLAISCGDNAHPGDSMIISLDLSTKEDTVSIRLANINTNTDAAIVHRQRLSLTSAEESVTFSTEHSFDSATKTLNGTISLKNTDNESLVIDSVAEYSALNPGKDYDIKIKEINITNGVNTSATLFGTLRVKEKRDAIEKPSGSMKNLLEISEEDISSRLESLNGALNTINDIFSK